MNWKRIVLYGSTYVRKTARKATAMKLEGPVRLVSSTRLSVFSARSSATKSEPRQIEPKEEVSARLRLARSGRCSAQGLFRFV